MTCLCQKGAVCNADKAADVLQPDCVGVVPQKGVLIAGVSGRRPFGVSAGHSKMRRLVRALRRRGDCSVFCAAQRSGIRRREVVILLAWLQSAGYVVLRKIGKSNMLISGTAALAELPVF